MLLQQTTVEGVGAPRRVGDHARKGDDTARRTHPFEHRLTRDPFGHPVEPTAPFGERRRQESIALRENLLRHPFVDHARSEEHTSELQSLMRISYAVFCLKKKKTYQTLNRYYHRHT